MINVGGEGVVSVDGHAFELSCKDALYVAMGRKEVVFSSNDSAKPAKFYLNSAPAHQAFTTKKVTKEQAIKIELGSTETANHRIVNHMIVASIVQTCQLQMGLTELKTGSI